MKPQNQNLDVLVEKCSSTFSIRNGTRDELDKMLKQCALEWAGKVQEFPDIGSILERTNKAEAERDSLRAELTKAQQQNQQYLARTQMVEEYKIMTKPTLTQMRIACAEKCGYKITHRCGKWYTLHLPDGYDKVDGISTDWTEYVDHLPPYDTSLDAMHEAFSTLNTEQKKNCTYHTINLLTKGQYLFDATAQQWVEAFCRTTNPEIFSNEF